MKTLFETFRRAMMFKSDPSRKEVLEKFRADVKNTPALIDDLVTDYFERQSGNWMQTQTSLGRSFEKVQHDRKESADRNLRAFDDLKSGIRKIILMDLTLPNGKMLRYATGAECVKAGGFYLEVAKHVKSTQVVDKHLTEDDLKNIQLRFVAQKTKEPA